MRNIAIGLLLLSLTACGAASPTTGSDSTGATNPSPVASTPASTTAPVASTPAEPSAAAVESPLPSGNPLGGVSIGGGDFEPRVAGFLASQINQQADALTLQSKEEAEWSDGSLGCPDPATSYIQMIIPGYKLVYTDGTQTYNVHTNSDGSNAVWCDNGTPKNIGQP